jgi:nucleoid DNA-binding protein
MNTRAFINELAKKLNISQKEAEKLLGHSTRAIRDAIAEEKRLTVLHLGSFQVKKSASRPAYIPALDKKALMPPKNSIHFLPADTLKDKLKNYSQP